MVSISSCTDRKNKLLANPKLLAKPTTVDLQRGAYTLGPVFSFHFQREEVFAAMKMWMDGTPPRAIVLDVQETRIVFLARIAAASRSEGHAFKLRRLRSRSHSHPPREFPPPVCIPGVGGRTPLHRCLQFHGPPTRTNDVHPHVLRSSFLSRVTSSIARPPPRSSSLLRRSPMPPFGNSCMPPLLSMRLDRDEVVQARGDERTIADRHAWMVAPHVARGRPKWRCWCSRRFCGCTDAGDVPRGAGGGARERETRPGT